MDFRPCGTANVTFSQSTHPGLLRKSNEDCCGASPKQGAFVVCDGMGGAVAGEVASRLAVETFLGHLEAAAGRGTAEARLGGAIQAANHAVFRRARGSSGLNGMGTTLVAALLEPVAVTEAPPKEPRGVGALWIAHVGDSRCYLFRDGRLRLLTSDHSVVEEQVRAGLITRREADVSPVRHVITRAIGSQARVQPEIQQVEAYSGDLVLLASDGLNRELSDAAIERILDKVPPGAPETDLQTACQDLVDATNMQGGRDNVSVVLLRVAEGRMGVSGALLNSPDE